LGINRDYEKIRIDMQTLSKTWPSAPPDRQHLVDQDFVSVRLITLARRGGRTPANPTVGRRVVELLVVAAPTVAFLAVIEALVPSVAAAAVVAAAASAGGHRREPLRTAVPGLLIIAVWAVAAAATGQVRGFFLIPTLVSFAVTFGLPSQHRCRLAAHRHRAQPDLRWPGRLVPDTPTAPRPRRGPGVPVRQRRQSCRSCFYQANEPVVLGIAHTATGPVFATIAAVTLVFGRRADHRDQHIHHRAERRGNRQRRGARRREQVLPYGDGAAVPLARRARTRGSE
jgi:hypothetical protein